jgi:uncharacterized phage protein (TIGR01671 family)
VWEHPRPQDEFEGAMTYVDFTEDYDARFWRFCFRAENKDVYVIMQFSGLKDKDGREIYEGDLVCFNDDNDTYAVSWSEKYLTLGYFSGTECADTLSNNDTCQLIGNIYENPELLIR